MKPPCTERYAGWCERTAVNHRLLLDYNRIARRFASKSSDAKKNAEMLGLMVNEPHIGLDELSKITAPTLVICGKRDMIKESHTKMIAENIPNAKLTIIKGTERLILQEWLSCMGFYSIFSF